MSFQQVKNHYFQLVPELTEDIWSEIEGNPAFFLDWM